MRSEERFKTKPMEQKAKGSEPSYQHTIKVCVLQKSRRAQLSPHGYITTSKSLQTSIFIYLTPTQEFY